MGNKTCTAKTELGWVCNPKTGEWVKIDEETGKQILSQYKKGGLMFSGDEKAQKAQKDLFEKMAELYDEYEQIERNNDTALSQLQSKVEQLKTSKVDLDKDVESIAKIFSEISQ